MSREGAGYFYLDPQKPFEIEFDMLNLSGVSENRVLYLDYLMNDRWNNFGAQNNLDPVGFRLYLSIKSDTTIAYEILQKTNGEWPRPPGSVGTATVASGLLSPGEGIPGRPARILFEVYRNKQKLSIDGIEQFDLDIEPVPQNRVYGTTNFIQFWSSYDKPRGIDNLVIRQLEAPVEEPVFATPGDIYWASTTSIRTLQSDGSGWGLVADGQNRAIGIAVDPINEKVYWTDGGSVFRSDLNGANADPIYTSGTSAQGMAINPELGRIYWTEHTRGLFSADLDGGDVQQLINLAEPEYDANARSASVAVDPVTGQVYWANIHTGELVRMESDGSALTPIATLGNNPYGLAVDAERNRLYFTRFTTEGEAPNGTLNYLDLTTGESSVIFSGLGGPLGLAMTADGDGLFWAERTDGRIQATAITADGFGDIQTLSRLEDSPFGLALMPTATAPLFFTGFVNGNFEEEPFDNGWSVSIGGITSHPGIAPGSNTAVYVPNQANTRLVQYLPQWVPLIPTDGATDPSVVVVTDPTTGEHRSEFLRGIGPKWQFGFYAAGADAGTTARRSINLLLGHVPPPAYVAPNLPVINFRIDGVGGAQAYGPTAWQTVFPAGTFEPSEVVDGVFVDPNVYYIQFDGDYSTEDPYYTVAIARAGESEFFAVSPPMRAWQYGTPPAGSGIAMVHVHGIGTHVPYVVDDMHLVEIGAAPEGYAGWAAEFFSPEELADESIGAPGADPDGDGLANLLEYALGGLPREASVAELPETGVATVDGEDYLTLTFTRPTDSDVNYHVEASGELSGWAGGPVEVSSTDNDDGTTTVIYRDFEPVDSSERRFLRLRVSGE